MTLFDFIKELDKLCNFQSIERDGKASNSEIKRWIQNGAIVVNGNKPRDPFIEIEFPITSMILFPKGRRTTLW